MAWPCNDWDVKSFLIYFADDSQVTINATEIQTDATVLKILNGSDLVAVFPLVALQGAVDVSVLEDEDDDGGFDDADDEDETK